MIFYLLKELLIFKISQLEHLIFELKLSWLHSYRFPKYKATNLITLKSIVLKIVFTTVVKFNVYEVFLFESQLYNNNLFSVKTLSTKFFLNESIIFYHNEVYC